MAKCWLELGHLYFLLLKSCLYDIIHISMPFSQIIPPSPSPTECKVKKLKKKKNTHTHSKNDHIFLCSIPPCIIKPCILERIWFPSWRRANKFFNVWKKYKVMPTRNRPYILLEAMISSLGQIPDLTACKTTTSTNISTLIHFAVKLFWLDIGVLMCLCAQPSPTLCNPMDFCPPGSSVHGIIQARILEWVAISSCRRSSWPRDPTHLSCIGRQILYYWATWEAHRNASVQFSLVTQSCPTVCDPMNCSTPGLPVHHQLPEFTQTHVHSTKNWF